MCDIFPVYNFINADTRSRTVCTFFLAPKDEAARNMTLGELMDNRSLEIKIMEIEPGLGLPHR